MDGVAMRDPNMVAVNAAPKNFFDFGASLNDITARGGSEQGYIDGGKAIPTFAQAFFGAGAFSNVNRQMSLGKIRVSPNQAYAVPKTVAEWLGARVPSTVYTYADLLDIIVGRQTYQDAPDYRMFIPELTQTSVNHYDTLHPLFSFIQPAMPSDGTIWNLMSTMLNSPLNEMYVTLRVGPHGRVVPTLVARQAPYNTPAVAKEEPVGV
jgi:hypothetical protein